MYHQILNDWLPKWLQRLTSGQSIKFHDSVKNKYEILFEFGGSPMVIAKSRKLTNLEDCDSKICKKGRRSFTSRC